MLKVSASEFAVFLRKRLEAKDGYIMGATGQDPSKWSNGNWFIAQYDPNYAYAGSSASAATLKKAKYWRDHAQRVWDCNGLAEGYYKDLTGVNINTKARYNYSGWCGVKGTGAIPIKYRMPGAAVFSGKSAATISHVGFLEKPVVEGKPEGDWYVIEARGVTYGVVRTKLYSRGWKWWGLMTQYFVYPGIGDGTEIVQKPQELGDRTLRKGDKGNDVKALQEQLNALGYNSGTADGIFGAKTDKALRLYQKARGLSVDGVAGKQTYAELEKDAAAEGAATELVRLLKDGCKGEDVKELQRNLNALGYSAGSVDGKFGTKTETALKAFQKKEGLKVDGKYGEKSHAAMTKALTDR